jgi:hypothetical protein
MQKRLLLLVGLLLALPAAGSADDKILQFDTMVGVVAPFTGATNAIRGVGGGGQPWRLDEARGELRVDGRLEIEVKGLVLVSTGQNPAATFRAVVSCLTPGKDAQGNLVAATTNVTTNEFPATVDGDSEIEAVVALPSPCIAPIVFVTNAAGRWFAATGF